MFIICNFYLYNTKFLCYIFLWSSLVLSYDLITVNHYIQPCIRFIMWEVLTIKYISDLAYNVHIMHVGNLCSSLYDLRLDQWILWLIAFPIFLQVIASDSWVMGWFLIHLQFGIDCHTNSLRLALNPNKVSSRHISSLSTYSIVLMGWLDHKHVVF